MFLVQVYELIIIIITLILFNWNWYLNQFLPPLSLFTSLVDMIFFSFFFFPNFRHDFIDIWNKLHFTGMVLFWDLPAPPCAKRESLWINPLPSCSRSLSAVYGEKNKKMSYSIDHIANNELTLTEWGTETHF